MVDRQSGEIWHKINIPYYAPGLPKIHLWKNGYHSAEHTMIAYITTAATRGEPLVLYYALPRDGHDIVTHPYYFKGTVISQSLTPLQRFPEYNRIGITFAAIR
jgi:hypothetical protein